MITHQVLLRGAAQCYLLQTAMRLVDVVSVPVQMPVCKSFSGYLCTQVWPVVVLSKRPADGLARGVLMGPGLGDD